MDVVFGMVFGDEDERLIPFSPNATRQDSSRYVYKRRDIANVVFVGGFLKTLLSFSLSLSLSLSLCVCVCMTAGLVCREGHLVDQCIRRSKFNGQARLARPTSQL